MIKRSLLVWILAAGLLGQICACNQAGPDDASPQVEAAEIQIDGDLVELVDGILDGSNMPDTREQLDQLIGDFVNAKHADLATLVVQTMLLESSMTERGVEAEKRAMVILMVRSRLVAAADVETTLEQLMPYFESEDSKVREVSEELLGQILGTHGKGFDPLVPVLAGISPERSVNALRFLFYANPSKALGVVVEAYDVDRSTKQQLIQRDETIQSLMPRTARRFTEAECFAAIAELKAVNADPRWWIRLYTAGVLLRHQPFRDRALMDALLQDENETVRGMVSGIPIYEQYRWVPPPEGASPEERLRMREEQIRDIESRGGLEMLKKR